MASPEEELGEVIELSSDDEPAPSRKRSFQESDNSRQSGKSAQRSKRARTGSAPPAKTPDGSMGTEEGEVDEDVSQNQAGSPAPSGFNSGGDGASVNGTFVPPKGPVFVHNSLQFDLPVFSRRKEGSWNDRFKNWATVFRGHNILQADAITPDVVVAAYEQYIEENSGLKPKKKKNAKQAAWEAEERGQLASHLSRLCQFQKSKPNPSTQGAATISQSKPSTASDAINLVSESEDEYEPTADGVPSGKGEIIPSANEWASLLNKDDSTKANGDSQKTQSNGVNASQTTDPPMGEESLKQLRRYFPSAADLTNLCLLCGRAGHTSASCSSSSCKFCSSSDHWEYCCPTRARCGKCRQLGHSSSTCVEKLALTKDEGLACCFCNSADHLEEDCTDIWRSFIPDAESIHTVVSIIPSCSVCGSGQHYSADCEERRDCVGNPTWSLRNRDQYIDQESNGIAIVDTATEGTGPKVSRAPDVKIRGHAARTANVHYSESDDSESEFLGNMGKKLSRPKRAPYGQIRMASNIQMPSRTQPPLPPGPPPPGPPPREPSYGNAQNARGPPGAPTYNALPSVPPPSLPARPPPRDYRDVLGQPPQGARNQPRQNGGNNASGPGRGGQRGGRGGRGRGGRGGRGRGRGKG